MACVADVMGTTLTVRTIAWQQLNFVTCSFFSLYFAPHTTQTAHLHHHSPLSKFGRVAPALSSIELRQNCGIATQYCGQTL